MGRRHLTRNRGGAQPWPQLITTCCSMGYCCGHQPPLMLLLQWLSSAGAASCTCYPMPSLQLLLLMMLRTCSAAVNPRYICFRLSTCKPVCGMQQPTRSLQAHVYIHPLQAPCVTTSQPLAINLPLSRFIPRAPVPGVACAWPTCWSAASSCAECCCCCCCWSSALRTTPTTWSAVPLKCGETCSDLLAPACKAWAAAGLEGMAGAGSAVMSGWGTSPGTEAGCCTSAPAACSLRQAGAAVCPTCPMPLGCLSSLPGPCPKEVCGRLPCTPSGAGAGLLKDGSPPPALLCSISRWACWMRALCSSSRYHWYTQCSQGGVWVPVQTN
jgi:hypothetical protein